jgi:hypothetical protein
LSAHRRTVGILYFAAAASLILGQPALSFGWSRFCRWSPQQASSIPTLVHCDSFESLGYDCESVIRVFNRVRLRWNQNGGTDVRLGQPTATAFWGPAIPGVAGSFIYRADNGSTSSGVVAVQKGSCNTSVTITVFTRFSFSLTRPTNSGNLSMAGILLHETGHGLGFWHHTEMVGGCGGVQATTSRSVMNGPCPVPYCNSESDCAPEQDCDLTPLYAGRGVCTPHPCPPPEAAFESSRDYDAEMLFHDDWIGLRSGACPYTPAVPAGAVTVRRSADGGATWMPESAWPSSTNLTPAIVAASGIGVEGFRIEAAIDANNRLVIRRRIGTGVTGAYLDPQEDPDPSVVAAAGPALAWDGVERFLLVYPTLGSSDDGRLRVLWTTDAGNTWEGDTWPVSSTHRVGIAWHASRGRFYVAFAEGPAFGTGDGCLNCGRISVLSTVEGADYSAVWVHPAGVNRSAAAGPGIACPPGQAKCWIVFPDADVLPETLRQVVVDTGASGTIFGETNTASFPVWNGRWITSMQDVTAAFDPSRMALVYAFQEQDAGASMDVVWLPAQDVSPPVGFATDPISATSPSMMLPISPGFLSGSGPATTGIVTGVGVSVDPATNIVYAIAQK